MGRERSPVPGRREVGVVRHRGVAHQELRGQDLLVVGAPLPVRAHDVVVAGALVLPARVEKPQEGAAEIAPHARDPHQ